MTSRTFVHASRAHFRVSTLRSHDEFCREMTVRTWRAIAPASSVRPARISRFLRRSIALTVGVTKRGSVDATVIRRSGSRTIQETLHDGVHAVKVGLYVGIVRQLDRHLRQVLKEESMLRRRALSESSAFPAFVVGRQLWSVVSDDCHVVAFDGGCDDLDTGIDQFADVYAVEVAVTTRRLINDRCQRTP